jgi:hypothetical protein
MKTWESVRRALRWAPISTWQRLTRPPSAVRPLHVIIALADHFEPSIVPGRSGTLAGRDEQLRRLERWVRQYPAVFEPWRDKEGWPFRHTYFYPAEQYDAELVALLAEHCRAGWGEIEIQLHHGVGAPDTGQNTRRQLEEFRDRLVSHGCLSRWEGDGPARYGFVHGNWALANSREGECCGVDEEMQILSDTGCYGDFTLPSAPNKAQVAKINAIYECNPPLARRAPHRSGQDLRVGHEPKLFPLIVQGPLLATLSRRGGFWPVPGIENSAVTTLHPPSLTRLMRWMNARIVVHGRPEWVFIKLHCHGMDPRDEGAMLGDLARNFLREIAELGRSGDYIFHFVTAREMVNILLAACAGREGDAGAYRDFRLRLATPVACP